ncbi:hypothetical protein Tco_0304243 [Tanacetum coccineum]
MSSESTSSQTPQCLLTPSSKVKFQHHKSIIAYNNVLALLEHHDPLYRPMLSFLSNCNISTALTKEPSAMYVEYLKDFWYTVEVDDANKDISFSLSLFENQLSFTRFDFLIVLVSLILNFQWGPEVPLILSSEKVNAKESADKSQSGTNVQPLSQPKAPTAKKPKKKKIPSSTQPKVSNVSREMDTSSTTTHLQATEELVAIVVPI